MDRNKSNIELLAIGIGHDVTRYIKEQLKYRCSRPGDVMINQLTDLFVEKTKKLTLKFRS